MFSDPHTANAREPDDSSRAGEPDDPCRAGETSRALPVADEELGRLLQSLRPRLCAVAFRFTRDADAADDVVQNAFEKAIRHRGQFRGQARVSTWLHRIVANEALMWLRARRRQARRLDPLAEIDVERLVDPRPDACERVVTSQASHRLRQGIAALDPDDRAIIERCVLPGRSYGEYGARHGLHPAAAKSRAFRARRRLHALLSAD